MTDNLLLLFISCCIVPSILFVILAIIIIRRGKQLLMPDTETLQKQYAKIRAKNPNADADKFARKIVQQQAMRAGLLGGITSVGGLPLLPLGLGIDMYTSARMQNATLTFLAWAFNVQEGDKFLDVDSALALVQNERLRNMIKDRGDLLAAGSSRQITKIIMQKAAAKVIPFAGFFIGFAVNYMITRGISEAAIQYYKRNN